MTKLFVKSYENKILGVSGFTRSGKAMMMNLLSTFKNVEKSSYDVLLEQIYYLHKLKKINYEAAEYLLKKNFNINLFENSIGRNVNYKINDFSSAYNFCKPSLYLDRSKSLVKKKNNISKKYLYQIMLHFGLNSCDLLFSSLNSLRIIEMYKNPLEIVFSWIKKGYGQDIYKRPNTYLTTIKYNKNVLPLFAYGWEKQFLKMNQYEKCANTIIKLYKDREIQIKKLDNPKKKRILFIYFDNFVNKPDIYLKKIKKFINRNMTQKTTLALKKEKIPRDIFTSNYLEKVNFLKNNLTKNTYKKLNACQVNYLKKLKNEN